MVATQENTLTQRDDLLAASKNTIRRLVVRPLNPIASTLELLGDMSRSKFYSLVREGKISLAKVGTRSYVTDGELLRLVRLLESGESL